MESQQTVLVVGWYGNGNLGDEAFRAAFAEVLPGVRFEFRNEFPSDLSPYAAVIIGGGSVLDAPLPKTPKSISKPVAFVGIDDRFIHDHYKQLIGEAKLVISRNPRTRFRFMPDLVFATTSTVPPLSAARHSFAGKNAVLFLNDFWTASAFHPKYKHVAFEWFCHEFAGALDALIEEGWSFSAVPMCVGAVDDRRVAGLIQGLSKHPNRIRWETQTQSEQDVRTSIRQSSLVISGRFHGCVWAAQQAVPFLALSSHDKFGDLVDALCPSYPGIVPYYGFQKKQFIDAFRTLASASFVWGDGLWAGALEAKRQWVDFSASLARTLFG